MTLFDDLPDPVSEKKASKRLLEETDCDIPIVNKKLTKPSIDLVDFVVSDAARKGERAEMQDAHIIIPDLRNKISYAISSDVQRISLFAIFDGHGGDRAANFAKGVLPTKFSQIFPTGDTAQIEKDMKKITVNIYKKIDEEFLKEACKGRPHWKDGSTASSILLVNNTMYISNIGDSMAVIGRCRDQSLQKSKATEDATTSGDNSLLPVNPMPPPTQSLMAIPLTRDHTPLDYDERQRIIKCGASVVNGRINNALEISRSFGDYQFKKQGVICIPDVKKYDLTDKDRFLIIACDGLWKCFTPDEAVSRAAALLSSNNLSDDLPQTRVDSSDAQRRLSGVCSQLANEAVLRLSGDNVTCIIVLFIPPHSRTVSSN